MSNENDWLMSVFDMERILASAPSRRKWDIARHVLTHVQNVAASVRRPTLSDEAVERGAKGMVARRPVRWDDLAEVTKQIWLEDARRCLTAAFSPPEPVPSSPVTVEAVGWQRGERELAARWAAGLLAKLSTKPDHADDCLWLERLAQLLTALPTPSPVEREGWQPIDTVPKDGTYVDLWVSDHRATDVRWSKIVPDEYGFDHAWINSAGDFVVGEDEEALYWMRVERPAAPAQREVGEPDACPICLVAFKPDDMCLIDIELGTCHAACLDGSPMVDLETGDPLPEGVLPKPYRYEPDAVMCGGCGNSDPNKRCIGCGHDFYPTPPTGGSNG